MKNQAFMFIIDMVIGSVFVISRQSSIDSFQNSPKNFNAFSSWAGPKKFHFNDIYCANVHFREIIFS